MNTAITTVNTTGVKVITTGVMLAPTVTSANSDDGAARSGVVKCYRLVSKPVAIDTMRGTAFIRDDRDMASSDKSIPTPGANVDMTRAGFIMGKTFVGAGRRVYAKPHEGLVNRSIGGDSPRALFGTVTRTLVPYGGSN